MKQWRGRFLIFIPLIFLISSFVPCSLRSQQNKSIPDQLSQEADVIVVGNVDRLTSEWDAKKSRIQTKVTIAVSDIIKGENNSHSLTVVIPGGEVDGIGEWYSHTASFKKDENVVVFAKKDMQGMLRVASGQMGKYTIKKDETTGRRMIPNIGYLDQFTSHIKTVLQSQQPGLKQK